MDIRPPYRHFSRDAVASVVTGVLLVDKADLWDILGFISQESADAFIGSAPSLELVGSAARRWLLHCYPELNQLTDLPQEAKNVAAWVATRRLRQHYKVSPWPHGF